MGEINEVSVTLKTLQLYSGILLFLCSARQQKHKNHYKFKQSIGGMRVRYLGLVEFDGKEIKITINQIHNDNKC